MAEQVTSQRFDWAAFALWVLASIVGLFFATLVMDSAFYDGEYIPMGNDSFYHAARMLDTAVGERGFYQFDDRIHVPDGSWIPWPWAYDYLMGKAAALAVWISPATDPLGFLSFVPVVWLPINAALFLAAAGQAQLRLPYRAIAALGFALAPFVQLMHMVGKVDHHFIEFTFVLLVTWLGLRWLGGQRDSRWAIALGIALGLSQGFHNGLFILQIPVLLSLGILWLRGESFELKEMLGLSISLLVSTLVVVVPSEPFQAGLFEFGLLSWFHLYAAFCSAVFIVYIGWKRFSQKSLVVLGGVCALLALPLFGQLIHGAAFLSQELTILEGVLEAMSPYTLFFGEFGVQRTVGHYSWLLLLAPVVLLYYVWCAAFERNPRILFFSVMTVFGIAMLLVQFRFNYFGLFALIVGTLLAVQRIADHYRLHSGMVMVGLLAGLLIAYQPPLRQHLFAVYALGAAPIYENARPIFVELSEHCENDPGVVLANANDGNYLLFHTECSVVSNNFRLTAADEQKIAQIDEMMRLSPIALREDHPDIRYLVLRITDFVVERDGGRHVDTSIPFSAMLVSEAVPPEGYELIKTVWLDDGGRRQVYAKAFAIH